MFRLILHPPTQVYIELYMYRWKCPESFQVLAKKCSGASSLSIRGIILHSGNLQCHTYIQMKIWKNKLSKSLKMTMLLWHNAICNFAFNTWACHKSVGHDNWIILSLLSAHKPSLFSTVYRMTKIHFPHNTNHQRKLKYMNGIFSGAFTLNITFISFLWKCSFMLRIMCWLSCHNVLPRGGKHT